MKRCLGLGTLLLGVWMGTHAGMAGKRKLEHSSGQKFLAKVHVSSAETSTGLNDLPVEILWKIFEKLPPQDQISLALTGKHYYLTLINLQKSGTGLSGSATERPISLGKFKIFLDEFLFKRVVIMDPQLLTTGMQQFLQKWKFSIEVEITSNQTKTILDHLKNPASNDPRTQEWQEEPQKSQEMDSGINERFTKFMNDRNPQKIRFSSSPFVYKREGTSLASKNHKKFFWTRTQPSVETFVPPNTIFAYQENGIDMVVKNGIDMVVSTQEIKMKYDDNNCHTCIKFSTLKGRAMSFYLTPPPALQLQNSQENSQEYLIAVAPDDSCHQLSFFAPAE